MRLRTLGEERLAELQRSLKFAETYILQMTETHGPTWVFRKGWLEDMEFLKADIAELEADMVAAYGNEEGAESA